MWYLIESLNIRVYCDSEITGILAGMLIRPTKDIKYDWIIVQNSSPRKSRKAWFKAPTVGFKYNYFGIPTGLFLTVHEKFNKHLHEEENNLRLILRFIQELRRREDAGLLTNLKFLASNYVRKVIMFLLSVVGVNLKQ